MKHKTIKLAFLCALFLLFSSFNANAAHFLAADIKGQVVDANKQPVVGAVVVIEQLETGRVLVRKTDKRGRYRANNVRHDGTYRVTVISPQGNTYSFEGTLQLGRSHTRHFVVDYDTTTPPDFMRSWQWSMDRAQLTVPA